jgi:hypothetical protein
MDDEISREEREKLILMAASVHGAPLNGPYTANCGRVLGQALIWACLWNDTVKEQLYGDKVGDTSTVEAWYATLIAMTKHIPESETLIQGWGNLNLPAAPAYTSCGLTSKGWDLAEKLLADRPHLVAQSKKLLGGFETPAY